MTSLSAERVAEVAGDFRHIDTTKAGHARLRIGSPGTGQECQDPKRLIKLCNEDSRSRFDFPATTASPAGHVCEPLSQI
jgi:hypothetical protein